MHQILHTLGTIGLIPVVKIEDAAKAVPLGKALAAGGLPCLEITFRTAAAADAIRNLSRQAPELLVGAGTVVNAGLAKAAIDSGARFIVSPGFDPAVVDYCLERDVPVVPGVSTASEIQAALEKGLEVLKFFPAEVSGGTAMLDALAGPFPQVSFIPSGGIDQSNLAEYARRANVLAVGGTWMAKTDMIEREDWATITGMTREALTGLQGFSFAHMGINSADAGTAADTAARFALFGFEEKPGTSSIFNGSVIEVMKAPFRGERGHIGLACWNVERALAFLEPHGFRAVAETAKFDKGRMSVVYLEPEIGGFAVHLVRAK